MNFNLFVIFVFVCGVNTTGSFSTCSNGSSIKFDLATWRNASGHRNVKNNLHFYEHQNKNSTASWDVQICSDSARGIRVVHISSSLSIPEEQKGPEGYVLAPGIGWYRLHLEPLFWEQAKAMCEYEGAHLAILNSQPEADVLQTMLFKSPKPFPNALFQHIACIGFTKKEGKYVTIFGDTLKSSGYNYSAELRDEGTASEGDKNCGGLGRDGKLYYITCKKTCAFFCEYPLSK